MHATLLGLQQQAIWAWHFVLWTYSRRPNHKSVLSISLLCSDAKASILRYIEFQDIRANYKFCNTKAFIQQQRDHVVARQSCNVQFNSCYKSQVLNVLNYLLVRVKLLEIIHVLRRKKVSLNVTLTSIQNFLSERNFGNYTMQKSILKVTAACKFFFLLFENIHQEAPALELLNEYSDS